MKKNLLMLLCAVSLANVSAATVGSEGSAAAADSDVSRGSRFVAGAREMGRRLKANVTGRFNHWGGVDGERYPEDVFGDPVIHNIAQDDFDGLNAGQYWADREEPTESSHYTQVTEGDFPDNAFRPVLHKKGDLSGPWYKRHFTGAVPNLASILGRGAAWGGAGYAIHKNRGYNWLRALAQQRLAEKNLLRRMIEHKIAKNIVNAGFLGLGFAGDALGARITNDTSAAGAIGRGTAKAAGWSWDKAKAGWNATKARFRSQGTPAAPFVGAANTGNDEQPEVGL